MSVSQSWLLPVGDVILGRYYLVELIGKGPVGAVYRATDRALDRQLVIKVLHPDLFDIRNKDTNAFRVMRARAHLSEHVASIHEVYLDSGDVGAPFFVEELISGPNLRQLMQRRADSGGILTFSEIRLVMEGLCKALRAIHRLSIHGNLKPENVFLLGTAIRVTDPYYLIGRTRLNWLPGEFPLRDHYLASEQLMRGQEESIQSDIFALGMLFGEMIVGEAVRFGVPLSDQGPEVPAGADRLFLKATANESLNRHATVESFLTDLRRVLPDEALRVDVEDPDTQIVQLTDVLTSDEIARIAAVNRARQAERAAHRQDDVIAEAVMIDAWEAEGTHDALELEEVEELAFVTPVEATSRPEPSRIADEDMLDKTMIDTPDRLALRLQQEADELEAAAAAAVDDARGDVQEESPGDHGVIDLDSDHLSAGSDHEVSEATVHEHRGFLTDVAQEQEIQAAAVVGVSGGLSLGHTFDGLGGDDSGLAATQMISKDGKTKTVVMSGTVGGPPKVPAVTPKVSAAVEDEEGVFLEGDEDESAEAEHVVVRPLPPVPQVPQAPPPGGDTGKKPIDPRLRSFAQAVDLDDPTLMTTLDAIDEVELRPHPKKKKGKKKKGSGNTTVVVPPPMRASDVKAVEMRVAIPAKEAAGTAKPTVPPPSQKGEGAVAVAPAVPAGRAAAVAPSGGTRAGAVVAKTVTTPARQPVAAVKKTEKSSGAMWIIAAVILVAAVGIGLVLTLKDRDTNRGQTAVDTTAGTTAPTAPVAVAPVQDAGVESPPVVEEPVEDVQAGPADAGTMAVVDTMAADIVNPFATSRRPVDESGDRVTSADVAGDPNALVDAAFVDPRQQRRELAMLDAQTSAEIETKKAEAEAEAKKAAEAEAKKAEADAKKAAEAEAKKAEAAEAKRLEAEAKKAALVEAKKAEADARKAAEAEAKKALALANTTGVAANQAAQTVNKNDLAQAAEADAAAKKAALAEKKAAEAEAKKAALAQKKAEAEAKKAEAAAKKAEALAKKKAEAEAKKAARLAGKMPPDDGPPTAGCPGGMRKIERNITRTIAGQNVMERTVYCIDAYEYPGKGATPKTGISWHGAASACQAKGKRLCTSSEWKGACGGKYPYGGIYEPTFCNTMGENGEERSVVAAGSFPKCKSPYGLYDMSGNVSEWTADKTVNGGNSTQDGDTATCSRSPTRMESSSSGSVGFRCCADPE